MQLKECIRNRGRYKSICSNRNQVLNYLANLNISAQELQEKMTELLDQNQEANFFCDETPIGGLKGVPIDFLISFSEGVKRESFFWLACNNRWPTKTELEKGKVIAIVLLVEKFHLTYILIK